jgi:P-type Cu2+ transporter
MEHDKKNHKDQPESPDSKPAQADAGMKNMPHDGANHHAHMAADFQKWFWISLILTLPILILSPLLKTLAAGAPYTWACC